MDYYSDEDLEPLPRQSTPARGGREKSAPVVSRTPRAVTNPDPAALLHSASFIPRGINWLNVPESVKESVSALDAALLSARKETKRLEKHVQRMEEKLAEVSDVMERMFDLFESEKQKNAMLRRDVASLTQQLAQLQATSNAQQSSPRAPEVNKDQVVAEAVEELKQLFRPDEIRQTLKKVEVAMRQPNQHLARRVEALEQFRQSAMVRQATTDQIRKAQKVRLEEATSALRKLSV